MSFISCYCNVLYDGEKFKVINNNEVVYEDVIKVPDIFLLEIENDAIISFKNLY